MTFHLIAACLAIVGVASAQPVSNPTPQLPATLPTPKQETTDLYRAIIDNQATMYKVALETHEKTTDAAIESSKQAYET